MSGCTDDCHDSSGRAGELRWRWRMLVLDMLYFLVVVETDPSTAKFQFLRRVESLKRDLEKST